MVEFGFGFGFARGFGFAGVVRASAVACLLAGMALPAFGQIAVHEPVGKPTPDGQPASIRFDANGGLVVRGSFGHSHNDYLRARPLFAALDAGLLCVEADVFCRDGQLLVGHTLAETDPARTLDAMYLKPLAERLLGGEQAKTQAPQTQDTSDNQPPTSGGSEAHPSGASGGGCVVLMVDIKDRGLETWRLLEQRLAAYPGLCRSVVVDENGQATVQPGPVVVVVSGDRPVEAMRAAAVRWSGIDGRFPRDIDSDWPAHLMPMVSCSLGQLFDAAGKADPERFKQDANAVLTETLADFARQATADGRLARVWGTPDNEATWQLLWEAGMPLVNTDQPQALNTWLTHPRNPRSPRK